jgi:hypothetical protein
MLIRALLCEHQVMSLGALKASSIASARDVEAKKGNEIFCVSLNFSSLGDVRRRFRSEAEKEL